MSAGSAAPLLLARSLRLCSGTRSRLLQRTPRVVCCTVPCTSARGCHIVSEAPEDGPAGHCAPRRGGVTQGAHV
eukprot:14300737-Alexandrium_andersonii.AAC.1